MSEPLMMEQTDNPRTGGCKNNFFVRSWEKEEKNMASNVKVIITEWKHLNAGSGGTLLLRLLIEDWDANL